MLNMNTPETKKKHFLPYLKEEKPSNLRIITTFFDRNAYLIEANV